MRNNVAGIDFAYRTIFADVLKAARCRARRHGWRAGSSSSTRSSAASDLRHVDVRALRRASEELVIALQAASTKLGLPRPTLEAQSR